MKKLFLADISVLNESKLAAILKQAGEATIEVPFGTVDFNDSKISFNTALSEDQKALVDKLNITLVPYKDCKRNYNSYDERYLVRTSDELLSAFVFDMNLEGREDIQVLNFETPDVFAMIEELRQGMSQLIEQNRALLNELNDLKLRVSSIIAVLPEEQRKQAVLVLENQKKSIGDTMQKATEFGKVVQELGDKGATILDVLNALEERLGIQGLALAVSRNFFKLKGIEESEEELTKVLSQEEFLKDKALFQAVVATIAQG